MSFIDDFFGKKRIAGHVFEDPLDEGARSEYQVMPDSPRDISLTFNTRREAREYKKLLANSKHNIKSYIVRRKYSGDYIVSEDIVS